MRQAVVVLVAFAAVGSCERESATGITFADKRAGLALVGTGVRTKGPIKVYAAGLYAAPMGCKMSMRKYKDTSPSNAGAPFYNDLVNAGFAKAIVLKMAMGISKEKLVGALSDSVRPRMKGGKDALPQFADLILSGCERHAAGGKASKGTELAFGLQGSAMSVSVNGKACGSVKSPALCKALLSCYLDEKAVSPSLKRKCAEGVVGLL